MTPTTAGHREKCELTMAITGAHTLFYTSEIDAFRAVMRDALKLPIMAEDGGFMIFGLPETTMEPHAGPPELDIHPGDRATHEVSFMCDDLEATIEELRAKGVEFRGEPRDMGWGVVIIMVLPGGVEMVLYEPADY